MEYTVNKLNEVMNNYNSKLLDSSYSKLSSNTKLSSNAKINFECQCGTTHIKIFKLIVKGSGATCKECARKNKNKKIGIASAKNQTIRKVHEHNLKVYGSKGILGNKEASLKIKEKMRELYGVEYALQNTNSKEKCIETNITKYGVKNVKQVPDIVQKAKDTFLEHTINNPTFNSTINEKRTQTCIEKYGVNHISKSEIIKEKRNATNLVKYGVTCSLQAPEIIAKTKDTVLQKYGVEYIVQNQEFMEKIQNKSYKYKNFIMPSGVIRRIQGYENYALDELVKIYSEEQIITDRKLIPRIQYNFNNKIKYYFPDIYIPHENKIIEVKSEYTIKCNLDINPLKESAVKQNGYNFEYWVYTRKGKRIEY